MISAMVTLTAFHIHISSCKIVSEYTYLGIVLQKNGSYKQAINKLTSAGK